MAVQRQVEVVVKPKYGAEFTMSGLKIAFSIEKTDSPDLNKGTIQIYNLSEETSAKVTEAGNHIILKAGYEDENTAAIFFGDILASFGRKRVGNNFITEFEAFDGLAAVEKSRVSLSYAEDTDVATVVEALLTAIGLPSAGADLIPAGEKYLTGFCFIGMATDGLRDVLNRYGLTYTIQDEMLYIMQPGKPALNTGRTLSPETGLLTTPQNVSDKTGKGDEKAMAANRWKFSSRILPDVNPGLACTVESSTFTGNVLIRKALFVGDSIEGDFKITIDAEAL